MKRLTIGLVILAGLALTAQAQASGKGHGAKSPGAHHGGKKGHGMDHGKQHGKNDRGGMGRKHGHDNWTSVRHGDRGPRYWSKRSFGYRFNRRPAFWVRSWNATCGRMCWWCPRTRCHYYWYAPERCYVPVSYCPSGSYNYVDAGTCDDAPCTVPACDTDCDCDAPSTCAKGTSVRVGFRVRCDRDAWVTERGRTGRYEHRDGRGNRPGNHGEAGHGMGHGQPGHPGHGQRG